MTQPRPSEATSERAPLGEPEDVLTAIAHAAESRHGTRGVVGAIDAVHRGLTPSSGTHQPLRPGSVLRDTYRIDALIAKGGMGNVYQATQLRLEGQVAIKVLHQELLTDGEVMSRFRSEATMMAGLQHPHIVQVFDFNVLADGTPYLVMELAKGQDLRSILNERHVLATVRVGHIVRQTASALGAAHVQGIIHRDLKPENIMLVPLAGQDDRQNECVKVIDFGVSKQGGQRAITVPSMVIGTPSYMAPEQAQGMNDDVDHRTDQYALGALAYTLLTGREPFRGTNAVSVLYQVVHEEAPPLQGLVDWPCANIEAVLQRAMAKDRNDRFPDIVSFARAFDDAVATDLATDPRGHCETPVPDVADDTPALAFAPPNDSPLLSDHQSVGLCKPAPRRRRSHRGWRRALLITGAAAGLAIGAGQETWTAPGGLLKLCGALSQGASQVLEFARSGQAPPLRKAAAPSAVGFLSNE